MHIPSRNRYFSSIAGIILGDLLKLAYQPVHQILIRINIKIRLIANNYNYLSHAFFHILNSNTYYKIHIYYYLVAIDFILHHTSMRVWYISNWAIYLWIGILISSSYMNTWWHISWVAFLYNNSINNILIMI